MKETNDTLVQIQKELSGIRSSLECIALAYAYTAGIRFDNDAAGRDIKTEKESTAKNTSEINLTVHVNHYNCAGKDQTSVVAENESKRDKELEESYTLYIADMECD